MFNFADLVLEHVTLEVRYENGYIYLDNCGKVLQKIINKWPEAKVESATVNGTKLEIPDKNLTTFFSSERISVTQNYPSGMAEIGEFSDFVIDTARDLFDINVYSRVGNRFYYLLKMKDEKESQALMFKSGFFNVPEEKTSKIGDTVSNATVRFLITKGGEIGYNISLGHMGRALNLQLPKPIKYDTRNMILSGLAIDIDFFTMKPIESGNVKPHELLKKNEKDMETLIPGLFK